MAPRNDEALPHSSHRGSPVKLRERIIADPVPLPCACHSNYCNLVVGVHDAKFSSDIRAIQERESVWSHLSQVVNECPADAAGVSELASEAAHPSVRPDQGERSPAGSSMELQPIGLR